MPSDIITARTAKLLLGRSRYAALIALGHHHTDERGRPYWLEEDWDDLVGLTAHEMNEAARGGSLTASYPRMCLWNSLS